MRIRMFASSLQGKIRNWFKDLLTASIINFHQFTQVFLDRWVVMGNEVLIIKEYNHLKRQSGEIVQDFSARFNKVYHAMPANIKPPLGCALLHYPDYFDPEMVFWIINKDPLTLEEMQRIEVDVEFNILNREAQLRIIEKDKANQERIISSEEKLKKLVCMFGKLEHLLDRKREKHKVKVNITYSNQPTLLPQDEHTRLLQDNSYKQNVPNGKVANKNLEECSKETISHFEITDSEMEEE